MAGDGLTIKAAGTFLGVPGPTLRSWERRYGLPTTSRSVGGHRRYRSVELIQLSLMRDEIAIGRPAADAARWVRGILDEANPGVARVHALLEASRAQDPRAIRAVLDLAHAEIGLGDTLDQVVMPAMRQVGAWWETGDCDVGLEHLTTEVVRGWLARIVDARTRARPGPADRPPRHRPEGTPTRSGSRPWRPSSRSSVRRRGCSAPHLAAACCSPRSRRLPMRSS